MSVNDWSDDLPVGGAGIPARVVEQIRRTIQEAGLAPGTKLPPERVLIEQLRVSRSSLREALRVLSTLGMVDVRHGDGIYVSGRRRQLPATSAASFDPTSRDALQNLLDARLGVELVAARLAAERGTEEDFDRLAQLIDDQERAVQGEFDPAWEPLAFELAVVEIAGNPLLSEFEQLLAGLWKTLSPRLIVSTAHYREWFAEHRAILASMRNRNPGQVQRLVLAHVTIERFIDDLAQRPRRLAAGSAGA